MSIQLSSGRRRLSCVSSLVSQEKDAQNTKKSTKYAIQAFRAFGDLQTAEKSVENLDKRLARFSANYFFYILHEHFSFSV